ncbi:MAG: sorbosone dehydrogenase family protein [Thermoanaerobaculia bacterium]
MWAPEHARAATYSVPGYTDTPVVLGLVQPTDFTWTPDGRMLILERSGRVRIVVGGVLQRAAALDHTGVTDDTQYETGFLGIALHPNFATTGELYIYYTRSSPCPISGFPPRCNRLSKFTMSGNTISAASEVLILDNISAASGNHNGGTVLIGPDGKLWIAPGDSGTGGSKAQDLDPGEEGTFSGKILRMELNGSPAAGNPFLGDSTKEQRIWAYGFRNPFRFSFRPSNGALFAGDVGNVAREELDAVTVPGGNYGWPMMEGTIVFQGPPCNPPACRPPVLDYPHPPGGGASISGGVFVTGSTYPGLSGAYVFGDWVQSVIRYAHIDANNALVGTIQDLATSAGAPVSFKMGPDGFLYYTAYFPGQIYRINPPPASRFHTVTPCRVADTRFAVGPYGGPALIANTDRTFTMTGRCGIPPTARAVSVNVTVTQATVLGDLRFFPAGAQLPGASTINFHSGRTRANNALLPLSAGGALAVRCVMPLGSVHLILDVNGYMD